MLISMLNAAQSEIAAVISARGLKQVTGSGAIEAIIDEVLAANQKSVDEFRAGRRSLQRAGRPVHEGQQGQRPTRPR